MLRITVIESIASSKKLKLEGRVTGASADELRRLCEQILARNGHGPLTLDCADVSFIDHEGIELLRDLGRHAVVAANCSSFVAELLKGVLPCS
jgi:anti-anti-sigma regulatory factor